MQKKVRRDQNVRKELCGGGDESRMEDQVRSVRQVIYIKQI